MRIVAISDDDLLVGQFQNVTADVVIALGDLLERTIEQAAAQYGAARTLAVKGNHDTDASFPPSITELHLSVVDYGGLRFAGFNGSWKYKPRGHFLYEQQEVSRLLRDFPPVDVFVAHNSPRGIHERDQDVHQGFDGFLEYLERAQPAYFLHGHQHVLQTTRWGQTEVIGVFGELVLDLNVAPGNRPDRSP